ncbi:MAG: hypothetical protein H6737_01780 [Alphaproteobacteria bacterium]|nr:hypothetical protein [Alphaproteobacteria bacterium]
MATFEELRAAVKSTHTLDRDDSDAFAVTIEIGSRAQRVMARRYAMAGVEMVELRSAFAEARTLGAPELLAANLTLPIGAVAQHGRFLVVVQKAVVTHTTVEGLLWQLTQVSLLADGLEQSEGTDRF